ncbi:aluminum-activated malate transporter 9 isoform X4 [Vigna radiata var. radiata]|uniref:Aluminum-activated malate transporter 9 isoform X4 n=1 Tax=Vigna radiata var. radiata TaxID=3916 RepID=A0A3Q0F8M1_VIGRR|nr:aluminum-activated malate transporter 9 isoform X4 [Vigna radiata var. radiata]
MPPKLVKSGSFRHGLAEKKERLLSEKSFGNISQMGIGVAMMREEEQSWMVKRWNTAKKVAEKAWEMGRSDPRKVVFSAKMGFALTLMSFLIYLKEPFKDMISYSVWAILTVVVVFEFSIGLSLGIAELSKLAGDWQRLVIVVNIFTVGEFLDTAINRFLLIALGAAVSLGVNICIYPIWAGEDLHNLVTENFIGVATSLEGVVNHYLQCVEYKKVPSKILTYQAADDPVYNGYRSAVESTSKEDSLMGFAVWEPPHGRYNKFRYPWKNYVKLSGALRHCAFMVMAMHGCILSEIQAPAEKRLVFRSEVQRVGIEGARVLRELGSKVKKMEKLGPGDLLFEVHVAAEELQRKIDKKSYLLVNSESWEIGNRARDDEEIHPQQDLFHTDEERKFLECKSLSEAVLDLRTLQVPPSWEGNPATDASPNMFRKELSWPDQIYQKSKSVPKEGQESKTYQSATSLSLTMFTSLLIEFVARLQNLVDSFEELGETANFSDPLDQRPPLEASPGFWSRLRNCLTFHN